MTKQQLEDAAWWRQLASEYERRAPGALCRHATGFGITGWSRDGYEILSMEQDWDLRATACCLIAAMVEAGDA